MGYVLGALMRLCILFALLSLIPPARILLDYFSEYRGGYGVALGREVVFLVGMPMLSGFFVLMFLLLRRVGGMVARSQSEAAQPPKEG